MRGKVLGVCGIIAAALAALTFFGAPLFADSSWTVDLADKSPAKS